MHSNTLLTTFAAGVSLIALSAAAPLTLNQPLYPRNLSSTPVNPSVEPYSCPAGQLFYACPSGNFQGCSSTDPCTVPAGRDRWTCDAGKVFYNCATGFWGCFSKDPCSIKAPTTLPSSQCPADQQLYQCPYGPTCAQSNPCPTVPSPVTDKCLNRAAPSPADQYKVCPAGTGYYQRCGKDDGRGNVEVYWEGCCTTNVCNGSATGPLDLFCPNQCSSI